MDVRDLRSPADLRGLSYRELDDLAAQIRGVIVDSVQTHGGHLGSNLGAVEITMAIHRVFQSPEDIVLFDTGHQAYAHKIVTGRADQFDHLRQYGGLSGYPSRTESVHDWIESSHASTALSYAHGLSVALQHRGELVGCGGNRHIVAVVGDGSLTGGMAFEALNNLGHSNQRVVIVLNDNGRSYAPTVSKLSESLTQLRLDPRYVKTRHRLRSRLAGDGGMRRLAYLGFHGVTKMVREMVTPHTFFENLGVRYVGPINGHSIEALEVALQSAAEWDGPIVIHAITEKGHGYQPAVADELKMHDYKLPAANKAEVSLTYTEAFSRALLHEAERDDRIVALTAAMAGPTGLLPFQEKFPQRFFDVGIAEQHQMTAAAGMAMGGLKPVVCVYSTFFARAFDQANLDVGLLGLPVVWVFDRAGITGDDGPSHHGVLDMALCLQIPGVTIFAPSCIEEVPVMLAEALQIPGPCAIRMPKTRPVMLDGQTGSGLTARKLQQGNGKICVLAVGKMAGSAYAALEQLGVKRQDVTLYDVRVLPPDPGMIADALTHERVLTIEDGVRHGGGGALMVSAVRLAAQQAGVAFPKTRILGVPRAYLEHDKPDHLLHMLGLDAEGIAAAIGRHLRDEPEEPRVLPLAPRAGFLD